MRLLLLLALALLLTVAVAVGLGETQLTAAQYGQAFAHPGSAAGEIPVDPRPHAVAAAVVGYAALGLAGAVMAGCCAIPWPIRGCLASRRSRS